MQPGDLKYGFPLVHEAFEIATSRQCFVGSGNSIESGCRALLTIHELRRTKEKRRKGLELSLKKEEAQKRRELEQRRSEFF